MRTYFALLDKGVGGERSNVCSGVEWTMGSLLQCLIEFAGVDTAVRQDPSRVRDAEQTRAVGDAPKICEATGWERTSPLDDSLAAMIAGA